MPTIRNAADLSDLKSRLHRLTSTTSGRWGQFTAPAMICHLADTLRVAVGVVSAKPQNSFLKRTLGKWVVVYTPLRAPPGKVKTRPEMLLTTPGNWTTDLAACEGLLDRAAALTATAEHPGFGWLTPNQWGRLIWKHFDHHLRQFGN